jgi:hypothetical protein
MEKYFADLIFIQNHYMYAGQVLLDKKIDSWLKGNESFNFTLCEKFTELVN